MLKGRHGCHSTPDGPSAGRFWDGGQGMSDGQGEDVVHRVGMRLAAQALRDMAIVVFVAGVLVGIGLGEIIRLVAP